MIAVNVGGESSAESAAPALGYPAEQYRSFPDCPRFAVGDSGELLYSPFTRQARTLSPVSVGILLSCNAFASLDDHADRLSREHNLSADQRHAVLAELTALARVGLLVSRTALKRSVRLESKPALPAVVATVGIPTRNRPDCLARCVESHLQSRRLHGRANDYVIVDDSDDPQARDRNRDALRALRARYGAPIAYAGPAERTRFARALWERGGVQREAVEFGLLNPDGWPIATGSSRNLLLLHAVGDLLLQVDDDTLARLGPSSGARRGLALSSRFDPTEFWFLHDGEPNSAEAPVDADLLAVHEQLLGRSLGDCVTAAGPDARPDFDETTAAFFRKGGNVLVTAAGVAGDSGMGSSISLLTLEGESRTRLLRSEHDYRHALAAHRVLRAVTRPTVCDAAFCMAPNLGLDNRGLLPPFLPVLRNQDGVFGALLRTGLGSGYFGFLPWVVQHKPPRDRSASPPPWRDAIRLRSGQIIQALLGSIAFQPHPDHPGRNLRKLGRALADLASLPQPAFDEAVHLQVWAQMSRQAAHLAAQLRRFGAEPDYWANDVRQLLQALGEELPNERYAVPADVEDGPDGRSASERFRHLVLRLGHLVQAWPDIVEAARDRRARGVRPAEPV
jgi:hypothetical protein